MFLYGSVICGYSKEARDIPSERFATPIMAGQPLVSLIKAGY